MSKSEVMLFSKVAVNGCWKWGEYSLRIASSYSYLIFLVLEIEMCINYEEVIR